MNQAQINKHKAILANYIAADAAAEIVSVNKTAICRWNRSGKITGFEIGSKVVYLKSEIEGLLKS